MKRRCRRFTLLEVIVAVGVFSMVSIALFGFSSGVVHSWQGITVERNRFNELLVTDRALDSIFTNAIPFMWRNMETGTPEKLPFVVAEPEMLRIAYMHPMNEVREGAIRFAEIWVEDNQLKVRYADRPFLDWSGIGEEWQKVTVLAKEVESIQFQYADWSSDTSDEWAERLFWRDEWETEDSKRKDIPLAIMATVKWLDGSTQTWTRRTTGNSFRERYGNYSLPADNKP